MKGRISVFVDCVNAGAVIEKRLGARMAPVNGGEMKRRPPIQSHRIDLRPFLKQQLQTFATVGRDRSEMKRSLAGFVHGID